MARRIDPVCKLCRREGIKLYLKGTRCESPKCGIDRRNVAPGIHRVEEAYTNWYVVEDDGRVTIVDAGLPRSWGTVQRVRSELGRVRHAVIPS